MSYRAPISTCLQLKVFSAGLHVALDFYFFLGGGRWGQPRKQFLAALRSPKQIQDNRVGLIQKPLDCFGRFNVMRNGTAITYPCCKYLS